jgi:hypothetical protein
LSEEQILAWADSHKNRTGQWPKRDSGSVFKAPDETWQNINAALKMGLRGLAAGSSLARLLSEERQVRSRRNLPQLTEKVILCEIRRSHFVVADFTLQRQNVYFEAGFAEALGLQVIYTCREDDIKNAHFDIRQRNHIVWNAPEELKDELKNRIGATIGAPRK